ncbi:gliolectin [Drosophila obscura]|uniref:gliolectin n=1 Tax=Drosophila obscura TaxID=7282 RepID=UPI001BB0F826|nr:gliolectin [Drosophila obscura]
MAPIQVPPVWSRQSLASAELRRPTPVAVASRACRNLFGTDANEVGVDINKRLAYVTEEGRKRVHRQYGVDIVAEDRREQELNRAHRLLSKCQAKPLEPFPAGVALTPSQIATTAKLIITSCAERTNLTRSHGQKPYGRPPQGIKEFYRERKAPKVISNVPKCNTNKSYVSSSSSNNNNNCPNNNNNSCHPRAVDSGNREIGTIVKKDE